MKKRSERREQCALAVVIRAENFSPRRRPLPGGAGRPKFNQLENLQTQFGEDRCTQFRVIVVTDPHTNTARNKHTNPQTGPITIHCAAKLSAQCKQSLCNAAYISTAKPLFCPVCFIIDTCTTYLFMLFMLYYSLHKQKKNRNTKTYPRRRR